MPEMTFYMKVLTQVVLWFPIKYLHIFSYAFFLWEDYGSLSLMVFAEGSWHLFGV